MTRQPIPRALMRDVWAHLRNRDQRPRAALPDGRGQLRITDEAGTAEIYLYDEIGYWGITASDFVEQLATIGAGRITLRINSPGGDVADGIAIYNALADHPATINVQVDGWACSAASYIMQAGDTRTMNRAAQVMIHDAAGFAIGNAATMREAADLLDRCSDNIARIYAARAGGTADSWREAMLAESWYSSLEAVGAGLADTAIAEKAPAEGVTARFDMRLTSFMYAGRAHAPRPAMPGRDRPVDQLPDGAGVDEPEQEGGGSAPRTEPAASPSPTEPAPVDWSALAAALRTPAGITTKEAAT